MKAYNCTAYDSRNDKEKIADLEELADRQGKRIARQLTEIERLNDEIEDREDAEQSWSNHVEELMEQCERYRVLLERWMGPKDPYAIVGRNQQTNHPLNAEGVLRQDTTEALAEGKGEKDERD